MLNSQNGHSDNRVSRQHSAQLQHRSTDVCGRGGQMQGHGDEEWQASSEAAQAQPYRAVEQVAERDKCSASMNLQVELRTELHATCQQW